VSGQTGQQEIYIHPFPGPGGRTPVSVGGCVEPAWAPSGEIFYRRPNDYRMMVVLSLDRPGAEGGPTPRALCGKQRPRRLAASPVCGDGRRPAVPHERGMAPIARGRRRRRPRPEGRDRSELGRGAQRARTDPLTKPSLPEKLRELVRSRTLHRNGPNCARWGGEGGCRWARGRSSRYEMSVGQSERVVNLGTR